MRWSRALVIGLVAAAGDGASADPATADRLIADAEALARSGKLVEAAAKFEDAFAADPRPELICNVGIAYHKAQDLPRAQLYLSRCLERGSILDGAFIDAVRAALARTETTLRAGDFTPVDITATPAGTTLRFAEYAPTESFVAPRVVWLARGTHELIASADGFAPQTIELVTAGAALRPVAITLAHGRAASAGSGSAVVHAMPPPPPPPPSRPAEAPHAASKLPAIAVTGVTVVLAAIAIVARRDAGQTAADAPFAVDDTQYALDQSAITHSNHVFQLAGIGALVGAAASGLLWYRATRGPRLEVAPARGGGALTLTGRF